MKEETSIYREMQSIIREWERGKIFFLEDFASIGDPVSVRRFLCDMVEDGFVIRLARGIYCYPRMEGEHSARIIRPLPETIAHALAKRENVRIIPYGDQAACKLGLCDLLIWNHRYLTDGSPRRINLSNEKKIYFDHTSEVKMFAFKSETMQLVSSAIRALGREYFKEDDAMARLREIMHPISKEEFYQDITLPPAWVGRIMTEAWEN